MRAAGYTRVSTWEQVREGYGLAAQEQAVRSYCQAQGWELVEVYTDAGRSGKSIRGRGELTRLLDDANAGHFERVVFWKLDRLGRNLRNLLEVCDRLEDLGVGIVSIQESIDTGTATGRMIRNVLGSLAEFEREIIVDRIKAGLAEKARQGELVGPLPLGYRREESGAIVADPVTAPLVRSTFVRYSTGQYSLREMAQWAGRVGLKSTAGNPVDRLSVRKILTNVSYTGQVAYQLWRGGDVVAKGKHPAIVDAALFGEVQMKLTSRRRRSPRRPFGRDPYPLTGVAVCGYDGVSMLGVKATNEGRPYMRCTTAARRGKEACRQPMVKADLLEAQVGAYVGGLVLPEEYVAGVVEELRLRRDREDDGEAGRLQGELERWRRLFVLGEIDEPRLRRETTPVKRRLAEIEQPMGLDVGEAVGYLRDVGRLWAESPRRLQREFVREVFARIVVKGPQVQAITPKPLYAPLFVIDREERFGGDQGVVWLPGQDSNLQPSG